jgi:protein SCO1/2
LVAVVLLLVGTAPLVAAATNPRADTALAETFDGTPAVLNGPAPDFRLVDQHGRPVSLATLRGDTVALTFLDPVCTTDCPYIAQEFKHASELLGPEAAHTRFVAIVANPIFNSLADVAAFDRQEGFSSQSNWLFLTGSRSALEKVWYDFGVAVSTAPAGAMIDHANLAFVIDARGTLRRGLDADPGPGEAADQMSFSALLAQQMQQVMG